MPETAVGGDLLYVEEQRTSPGVELLTAAVGVLAIGGGAIAAAAKGQLASAAPGLVIGAAVIAGVTAMIHNTRLRTRVSTVEAVITYRPWATVRIPGAEIAAVAPRRFGLFSGGIGYHVGRGSVALTARTGDGVVVTRTDGRRVLIGTQHPDALYSALLRLQARARSAGA